MILEHMLDERIHSFRDPLHGFIRLSAAERELVGTDVFQRLRRIHQLGTGYLVYHGAEHSRFGHSLGVLETATRMFQAIRRRNPDLLQAPEDWKRYEQILRLAALLHDVGHAPFSHASEELFPRESQTGTLFKHEDYTSALILNSELAEKIEGGFSALSIHPQDVVDVYSGEPSILGPVGVLLQDIVAGELDADRMDYLARDSLYAGVSYGRYDLERLLDTITAVQEAEEGGLHLAVDYGGLYALEAFLLARYYMFLQVYLHEDRRFYDLALVNTIQHLLGEGARYPPPADWNSFVEKDDIWVLSNLPRLVAEGNPWAECLLRRRHWKMISQLDERDPAADQVAWTHAQRDILDTFGPDFVKVDDAKAKTFQRTDPKPYITQHAEPEERPRILVQVKDQTCDVVERLSEIVKELSRRRIRIMRLYARPDRSDEVSLAWTAALAAHG